MAEQLADEFYTIPEAAKALRVSVSTVWRWIDAGRLPAFRVGQRRIRIRKQDLAKVVRPAAERKQLKEVKKKEPVPMIPMSPNEASDPLALIERARFLQEQILKARGGKLLPPSWRDINKAREERSALL